MERGMRKLWRGAVLGAAFAIGAAGAVAEASESSDWSGWASGGNIKHVLLISIDGMHAVDFINCASGLPGVNGGSPYCPNLAALGATGINYLATSTSKPSDSFPV
jgi:hypothetical protein